jgi:predicted Rossmann fold flavoprotein
MTAAPQVVVLGGGAAGFFAAIACAEENPAADVTLLERTGRFLAKVIISGGGRCNVTHACFEPERLVENYPRGDKALRGAFTRFQSSDTVEWFAQRGVELKTEADGRMFPVTNDSHTIAECLLEKAKQANVTTRLNAFVHTVKKDERGKFILLFQNDETLSADRLIVATGSNALAWRWASELGHAIEPPVPSLFTFTVKDARLEGLSGLSVAAARVHLEGSALAQTGALLITHWGFSGPAVLKLSAWGARWLHDAGYRATLRVNWLSAFSSDELQEKLRKSRACAPKKTVHSDNPTELPRRLWARLAGAAGIPPTMRWTELSNDRLLALAQELQDGAYAVTGKGVFKEEFVTCGGVRLDEVDFRTMQSKRCPGLYFAGEVLDIDGVTGGFNFQSAWTTGWLAGKAAAQ